MAAETGTAALKTNPNPEGSQLSYVRGELEARLHRLDSSTMWYRNRYYIWQMSGVTLSGIVTLLAGLKLQVWGRADLILVVSALSTVVSAWGAFFAPKELWRLNAETYGKLRALHARIEFFEREPNFNAREAAFAQEAFTEYQKIVGEHNQEWSRIRQKSS